MPCTDYSRSATMHRLIVAMALFADGRYHARDELEGAYLAAGIDLTERSAQRILSDMAKAGLIAVHPETRRHGQRTCWKWSPDAPITINRPRRCEGCADYPCRC